MTTPNQAAPDGAFTIGGGQWNYGQTMSESFGKSMFEMDSPTPDNMLELLRIALTRLPLDALKPFQGIFGLAEEFFDNVENAVGAIIDNLGLRPIFQTVEAFGEWVAEFFTKLVGFFTGDIDGFVNWFEQSILQIFSWLPLSHLFPKPVNLLKTVAFNAETDMAEADGWEWDGTTSASEDGGGSAKATCDGSTRFLVRNQVIFVEPGTKLNLQARVKSAGLTGANAKIELTIVEFAGDYLGDIVTVASRGPASSWSTFGGEYTVPTGVTSVKVRLAVTQATAGSVWFDNLNLYRSGLLQLNWIEGLGDALDGAGDWFQNFLDGIYESLTGIPIIGVAVEAVFEGLSELWGDAQDALAWAGDALGDIGELAWNLLNDTANFIGQIPQALVTGLVAILGSIGTQATNAWNGLVNLGSQLFAAPAAVVGSIVSVVVDGVATMGQFLTQLWEGLTGQTGSNKTVASVKSGAGSLYNAAGTAQITANTGVSNAALSQSTADNAEAQSVANAAELAKLVAAQASVDTSGVNAFDNFDYFANPFGTTADWAVAGSGSGGLVVDGTKLYWADSGGVTGNRICRFLKAKTVTPYQLVTMVLDGPKIEGPLGGPEAFNYIVGRLNSAFTSYVYAKIGYNSIGIYKVIAGVGEYQLGASEAFTPKVGDTIQFELGDPDDGTIRKFKVRVNGSTVITRTDGTGGSYGPSLSMVDAEGESPTHNYKWSGTAFFASSRLGGGQTTPGAVSIFSVADNKPAPMLGSGLTAYKTGSNGTISLGDNILPEGFYGTADKTPDLTYSSLTGRVTFSIEGWYQVTINQAGNSGVGANDGGRIGALLFKGAGTGSREVALRAAQFPWNFYVGFTGFSGTFTIYMRPGEWIEPGYWSNDASIVELSGNAQSSWFSVALLNRSHN